MNSIPMGHRNYDHHDSHVPVDQLMSIDNTFRLQDDCGSWQCYDMDLHLEDSEWHQGAHPFHVVILGDFPLFPSYGQILTPILLSFIVFGDPRMLFSCLPKLISFHILSSIWHHWKIPKFNSWSFISVDLTISISVLLFHQCKIFFDHSIFVC